MFNTYYVNFPKVYELKMMLSNVILTSSEIEKNDESGKTTDYSGLLGFKFLQMFNGELGASRENSSNNSKKVLETFEVKTTKSIILNDVVSNSQSVDEISSHRDGSLIRIDDVKLSLINEAELRLVKMFVNGNFKGLTVPGAEGVDLNEVINSLMKDYSYKLEGTTSHGEKVLLKIPFSFENEFENSYSIDDILLGSVTVIGLTRGKVELSALNNSFDFFQEIGSASTTNSSQIDKPLIDSSSVMPEPKKATVIEDISKERLDNKRKSNQEYYYIDLLSIIQPINMDKK